MSESRESRTLSPDGKWWWDGQRWQPVAPAAPPPPTRQRRPNGCLLIIIGGVALILLGVCVAAIGGANSSKSTSTATAAPTAATTEAPPKSTPVPAAPTAKPTPTAAPTVTFSVTGSAPNGVDITYGSDTDNRQGGTTLPWSATLPLDPSAHYYDVYAQLGGGGDITATVTITANGHTFTKTGHASGGYNIASAELTGYDIH